MSEEIQRMQNKAAPLLLGGVGIALIAAVMAFIGAAGRDGDLVLWMIGLFGIGAVVFLAGNWLALPIRRDTDDEKLSLRAGLVGLGVVTLVSVLVAAHATFAWSGAVYIVLYAAGATAICLVAAWLRRAAGA